MPKASAPATVQRSRGQTNQVAGTDPEGVCTRNSPVTGIGDSRGDGGDILGRDARGRRRLSRDLFGGLAHSARPGRHVRTGCKARGRARPCAPRRVRARRARRSQPRSLASGGQRGGSNQSSPRWQPGGNRAAPPPRAGARSVRRPPLHSSRSLSMAASVNVPRDWSGLPRVQTPSASSPQLWSGLLRVQRPSASVPATLVWTAAGADAFGICPRNSGLDCCGCRRLRHLSPRLWSGLLRVQTPSASVPATLVWTAAGADAFGICPRNSGLDCCGCRRLRHLSPQLSRTRRFRGRPFVFRVWKAPRVRNNPQPVDLSTYSGSLVGVGTVSNSPQSLDVEGLGGTRSLPRTLAAGWL